MAVETSIIIRTLNEAKHLESLMKGIHGQNYRDWEIILVDSGSTDGTLDIARRYGAHNYHIPSEEFTYGRSLNIGCGKAQGRYLVFASGHVWPVTNNWLGNLIRPFGDPLIAMVYGRQRGTDASRLSELRDLHSQYGPNSHILVDQPNGNNGNAAVRRDLWVKQPFDESLPGQEDVDWARKIEKLDYRVYYAADAAVYHVHEETMRQVYYRHLREAMATKQMFPNYRFSWLDMARGLPYAIARDVLYALRANKTSKVFQIPGTRLAHFLGIYQGVRYHKALVKNVVRRLQVPESHRSVVIKGPGCHSIRSGSVPQIQPDEVLVQVAFVGVSMADLDAARAEEDGRRKGTISYPFVPGLAYSGIVVRSGARAGHLRPGQKVAGVTTYGCGVCARCSEGDYYGCADAKKPGLEHFTGAYAEFLATPAGWVHKLPLETPLKHGALLESIATCLDGLEKLSVAAGRSACVIGAGPRGNICAQLLRSRGISVTSIDGNARWLALLHKYDIDTLADLGPLDGYDYLIDAEGDQPTLNQLMESSKPSARVLLLGRRPDGEASAEYDSHNRHDKMVFAAPSSDRNHWREAIRLAGNGVISLDDHTAAVAPLEAYEKAWSGVEAGEQFKVLLNVSRDLQAL